jgi:hypothetical protein
LIVTKRISKLHITVNPKLHHNHHKSLQWSYLYHLNKLLSHHSWSLQIKRWFLGDTSPLCFQ